MSKTTTETTTDDTVAIPADVKGRQTLRDSGKTILDATEPVLEIQVSANREGQPAKPLDLKADSDDEGESPHELKSDTERERAETTSPTARLPRRREILDEADEKIVGDRAKEYGHPQASFERVAALWTALDLHVGNRVYTAAQVALMLDLLKTARLAVNPTHTDSWVDKAGYSALGAEVSGA